MLIEIAQMVSNQPESCHHVVMRNVIEMRSTTQVRRDKISENMDQRLVKFATKFRKLGSQKKYRSVPVPSRYWYHEIWYPKWYRGTVSTARYYSDLCQLPTWKVNLQR
jgi:dTDP-4-amino-4,6-dideoxygalactose transaminase